MDIVPRIPTSAPGISRARPLGVLVANDDMDHMTSSRIAISGTPGGALPRERSVATTFSW